MVKHVSMIVEASANNCQIKQAQTFASGIHQELNIEAIRKEFPVPAQARNGKPLIYHNSAATWHKPRRVLDRLNRFYTEEYARPKESHLLSQQATELMEKSLKKMARFIKPAVKRKLFSTGAVLKASTWWRVNLRKAC